MAVPYRRNFSQTERRRSARSRRANTLLRHIDCWSRTIAQGDLTPAERRLVDALRGVALTVEALDRFTLAPDDDGTPSGPSEADSDVRADGSPR